MKERIKKYWKDNEVQCAAALGSIVTTIILTAVAAKAIDGMKVIYVGAKTENDLHTIFIVHKNQSWSHWDRPVSE